MPQIEDNKDNKEKILFLLEFEIQGPIFLSFFPSDFAVSRVNELVVH